MEAAQLPAEIISRADRIAAKAARLTGLDKDDLEQEALLAALADLRRFDPSRGGSLIDFLTYRLKAACKDYCRRERRRSDRYGESDAAYLVPDTQAGESIDDQFESLPPRDREACRLRFVEGLELAAIGEKLGISGERAGQIVRRATETLRPMVEQWAT